MFSGIKWLSGENVTGLRVTMSSSWHVYLCRMWRFSLRVRRWRCGVVCALMRLCVCARIRIRGRGYAKIQWWIAFPWMFTGKYWWLTSFFCCNIKFGAWIYRFYQVFSSAWVILGVMCESLFFEGCYFCTSWYLPTYTSVILKIYPWMLVCLKNIFLNIEG